MPKSAWHFDILLNLLHSQVGYRRVKTTRFPTESATREAWHLFSQLTPYLLRAGLRGEVIRRVEGED